MGVGAAVVAGTALVATFVPAPAGTVRLGLMASSVSVFSALTVDPLAVAAVAVLACLVFDGFVLNHLGELSWHGAADVRRSAALAVAAAAGLIAGGGFRVVRRLFAWRRWSHEVSAMFWGPAGSGGHRPVRGEKVIWNEEGTRHV
ncbi:hypothetical protein KRMM14A1259_45370 [Krasilnikovia sp. MM14-A1259]